MRYVDGAAVHWYTDFFIPPSMLQILNIDKEGWFFISSEASNGKYPNKNSASSLLLTYFIFFPGYLTTLGLDKPVRKGSWARGEDYIKDILDVST